MKKYLLVAILLSGCATANGPIYSQKPVTNGSQIVVYRDDYAVVAPTILVNGAVGCALAQDSYTVMQAAPGLVTVDASMHSRPEDSRISFTTKPGERAFVKVRYNRGLDAGAGFGAAGALAAAATTRDGTFILQRVYPEQANNELARMKGCN